MIMQILDRDDLIRVTRILHNSNYLCGNDIRFGQVRRFPYPSEGS